MNLCGLRKIASLCAAGCSTQTGFISISTYGAAAAKSQKARAPCSCSSDEIAHESVVMPVTLLAAENEPIFSGRAAWSSRAARRASRSMCPSRSSGITTTSAIDSRHGSSLLWCSNGPMKTTGRSSRGICASRS